MARGILAKKIGMTQVFDENGKLIPVTVLQAGPCTVTQVKNEITDKYSALQLGFGSAKEKNTSKAEAGHLKKHGLSMFRRLAEFRDVSGEFTEGQVIKADIFSAGEKIKATATSKGKGFQGVQKRYGFGGGRATHGSKFHRAPGSMGAGTTPHHVFKGKRLPGQTGNKTATVTNLKVFQVDAENNILMIKGAIPGPRTGIVKIEAMS